MQDYPTAPKPKNIPLIVCSVAACSCVLLGIPIIAAILFPVFAQAREKARAASCLSNEKQMALGVLMYVQDYDEVFPKASEWMTDINPYIKNEPVFHCPSVSPGSISQECGYAFDKYLSSAALADIPAPEQGALLYDSLSLGRNASDPCTSLPPTGQLRHMCDNIAFIDGHVRAYTDRTLENEVSVISTNPVVPSQKPAQKPAKKQGSH